MRDFIFSTGNENPGIGTWLRGLIGITEQLIDGELTLEEYEIEIADIEQRLQDRWEEVTRAYSKLHVESLNAT